MGKNNNNAEPAEEVGTQTPATGGTAERRQLLKAPTIEDLEAKVESLKASLGEGYTMTSGAVGRSRDDGTYMIRIDITFKKE